MKKIVEFLIDHNFIRLGRWLCARTGNGHVPIFYNVYGLEPDMSCEHCGEE